MSIIFKYDYCCFIFHHPSDNDSNSSQVFPTILSPLNFNAGVPEPLREVSSLPTRILSRETNYDYSPFAQEVTQQVPTLNYEQRLAYNEVSENISREEGGVIFLDKKEIPHEPTIGDSEIYRTNGNSGCVFRYCNYLSC